MAKIKTSTMKKNISYFIILFIICCCKPGSDNIYGEWRAIHVFYMNEEILNNDFEKNEWVVKFYKTKFFYLGNDPYNDFTLNLGEHDDKPVLADTRILTVNERYRFKVYNASDKRFNGVYDWHIETDTVEQAFKNVVYYLTLESKNTKIMAVKAKRLPSDSRSR